MGTPSYDDIQKAKVIIGGLRDYDGGRYRDLLERLGEFFPHAGEFAWLDQNDPVLGQCFTSAEGGWLEPDDAAEFWQFIGEADVSGEVAEPPPGLITFLRGLTDRWQGAASAPGQADLATPVVGPGEPRFQQVGPVGGDYPGWWQGYDTVDGVWKYVHGGDGQPTDQTPGWAISEAAFAAAPAGSAEPRFQQVGPVGGDYPGWWQGYDTVDGVWKYVHGGDGQPSDQTPGWAISEVAFTAGRGGAQAGAQAAAEPDINDLPPSVQDVVARLRALNDDYRDIPLSAIVDAIAGAGTA
jgi:hypothetical protein